MKSLSIPILITSVVSLFSLSLSAQSPGDFQSKASSAWNLASTWETYDGVNWIPATLPPTYLDGNILIKSIHTVSLTSTVTADQLLVQGNLYIESAGILNLANGTGEDLTIAGLVWLKNGQINGPGTVISNTGATLQLSAGGNFGAGTISTQVTNNGTLYWSNSTGGGAGTSVLTLTGGTFINNNAFNIFNTGGPMSHRIVNGDIINNSNITYSSSSSGVQLEFLVNKFSNHAGATIQGNASGKIILQAAVGDTHDGLFVTNASAGMQFKGAAVQVYSNSSNFSGTGPYDFNAGSHTFNGAYNAAATNITGATMIFNQSVLNFNALNLTAGSFGGPVIKNMNGGMGWSGGIVSGGQLYVPSGKTLTIGGFGYTSETLSAFLVNDGTINFNNDWTGCCGTSTFVMSGQTLTNNNLITYSYPGYVDGVKQLLSGGSLINYGTIKTTSTLNNVELKPDYLENKAGGLIFAQTNKTLTINVTIGATHDGDFQSNSSSGMIFSGPGSHVFTASSDFTGTGSMSFSSGSYTFNGTYTVATTNLSGATLNFNMASVNLGFVGMTGGTFTGNASRVLSGNMHCTGGTLSGSGTIMIPPDKTLSLFGGFSNFTIQSNIINNGTLEWNTFDGGSFTSTITLTGGSITNNGIFKADRGEYKDQRVLGGSIINHGTFNRLDGIGTTFKIESSTLLTSDGTINLTHASNEWTYILGTQTIGGTLNVYGGFMQFSSFNFEGPALYSANAYLATQTSSSRFRFTSSSPQNFSGTGTPIIQYMEMNGTGGLHLNYFLHTGGIDLTQGHIYIHNNNLELNGNLGGTVNSDNYIIIDGSGTFRRNLISTTPTYAFPVGTLSGYSPADLKVVTSGALGWYGVRVIDNVYADYDINSLSIGPQVPTGIVNRSWKVRSDLATTNVNVTLKWLAPAQAPNFSPATCRFATYDVTPSSWSVGAIVSGGAGPLYGIARNGITTLNGTTFAVVKQFTTATQAHGPYCSGSTFNVNYEAVGTFGPGNAFSAELSNASGDFSTPTIIGTINAIASGSIPCAIPNSVTTGLGYRIRVTSSLEPSIGSENGSDINITQGTTWYVDADNDGYGNTAVSQIACIPPAGYVSNDEDCNDGNADVHPGAVELCNGIDDDCDELTDDADPDITGPSIWYADNDGDGHGAGPVIAACVQPGGTSPFNDDCDDNDPENFAGNSEVCDGQDNDCDGEIDEDLTLYMYYQDQDYDGYGNAGWGTIETCQTTPPPGWSATNDDCDVWNPDIHPNAPELCNGIDDDCDGIVDDGWPIYTYYQDQDYDGYGNAGWGTMETCQNTPPSGWSATNDDCDVWNPDIHPNAPELCNGIDDDCDGIVDDGWPIYTYYQDQDYDGYGNAGWGTMETCQSTPPAGWSVTNDDCDPWNPDIHPGAPELCNGIDDDCDGIVDDGWPIYTYYQDQDYDGYGNAGWGTMETCQSTPPAGWSVTNDDCDPWNPDIHPGAPELCNGIDDDCDGVADDGVQNTYYADSDGDGFGNPFSILTSCALPPGYVINNADCDDTNVDVYPGAMEICNMIDDDCDGLIDENVTFNYYADVDGDGYGDVLNMIMACAPPSGYVANADDCNDTNSYIHPGALETCNSIDDDCDGLVDENVTMTYFADVDGDGIGNASTTIQACFPPAGYVSSSGDCNDNDPLVFPGQVEVCNSIDDDCDGLIDNADPGITGQLIWYFDQDGDGFGNPAISQLSCNQPTGYVGNDDDCDDSNPDINPNEDEQCNSLDDNCNGEVDERADCDENDFDHDGISDEIDNCVETFNPGQADTDCDGVGDACDLCPGGDDSIDNNFDGRPDCAYPPTYNEIIAAWKCGPKKVLVCHRPPGSTASPTSLCINFNALPSHMAHGDYLGPCGNANCLSPGMAVNQSSILSPYEDEYFEINDPGKEDETTSRFEIFPNPVRDQLEINCMISQVQGNISIYSGDGRLIWNKEMVAGIHFLKVPVAEFVSSSLSGIYFILLQDGQRSEIKTFVILQ